jgi:hypothetical protein
MDAVGKPNGLTRRKGSAFWYYRQRCPRHLKTPGVPEEVWLSLGTTDYKEAIKQLDGARDAAAHRFRGLSPAEPTGIFPRTSRPQAPSDPKLPVLTTGQTAILAASNKSWRSMTIGQRYKVTVSTRGFSGEWDGAVIRGTHPGYENTLVVPLDRASVLTALAKRKPFNLRVGQTALIDGMAVSLRAVSALAQCANGSVDPFSL